jgi:hypothetical protein
MSLSKLEYLPNEILFSIFKFLDGFHLVFAFGQLNYRFNILITHIHHKFNLTYCRRTDFDYLFDHIFPSGNNIHSLILSNYNTLGVIEMFIARYSNLISHNSLRYLKLMEIDPEALNTFVLTVLPKLTELVSLTVTTSIRRVQHFPIEVVDGQLPLLRHISLTIRKEYDPLHANSSGYITLCQIQPLRICHCATLHTILAHCPDSSRHYAKSNILR